MSVLGDDIVEELISEDTIKNRVRKLGQEITNDYKDLNEPVVLVGVLKGSVIFLADLCRSIDMPVELEMIGVSSYGQETKSSGVVRITQDLTHPIKDKHIIIVEDIFDTGLTLKYLVENFAARGPKSIKICSFLHKNKAKQTDLEIDYVGFNIEDKFVVGYGLDVAERLRNLPMVGVFKSQ